MFWKRVNLFRFKPLSLVAKLMLLYSLSTMGILVAISLFLYPTLMKVVAQINVTHLTYLAALCYKKVIIALLISSLTAIILGYLIARKGLNRLKEFEHKMEQITVDSLHERINLDEWPKELGSLGKKFNTMLDRLHTAFIQLSQFSSDIAHELRTPINNLRGMTEVALAKEKYSGKCQQLLEKYMDEYQHLSKLIESLLFFARSDNGQINLNKEICDTRKEILNISDYYQAVADENDIEITCQGDALIVADLILFKRVISNLLSNALRHTAPQGKINITIELVGSHVEIVVRDTGIGIAEEHLLKILDRFYRVDASRSLQSGGLGLGLAIVKSIIDLHQGKLTIESKLQVGTSVYLKLPSPAAV
jgi:two-component system heavy metal sensor histidine kinase CusS